MTDLDLRVAFLNDVLDRPEDDGLRLIYADFLEDSASPLEAELIRVQCELAAPAKEWAPTLGQTRAYDGQALSILYEINNHDRNKRLRALRGREGKILHHPHFAEGVIISYGYQGPGAFDFKRGLPHKVTLSHEDFLTHAKALFSLFPLEEVDLHDRSPADNEVLAMDDPNYDLFTPDERVKWFRMLGGNEDFGYDSEDLDERVWKHLSPPPPIFNKRWKWYADEKAAKDDLCSACVKWGKSLRRVRGR